MNAKLGLAQMIAQTAYAAYELTGISNLVLDSSFLEDLDALAAIIAEGQGLVHDIDQLREQARQLFDPSSAPVTRPELDRRLQQIQALRYQSQSYALRVQALGVTAVRVVQRLTHLIQTIASLIGGMQANQTMIQLQGSMHHTLTLLQQQAQAEQRDATLDRMTEALVTESLNRIQAKRLEGWPTWGQ